MNIVAIEDLLSLNHTTCFGEDVRIFPNQNETFINPFGDYLLK